MAAADGRAGRVAARRHGFGQFVRFSIVGASGYALNVGVFALVTAAFSLEPHVAATVAFLFAVVNNFWWNRHWTFRARGPGMRGQALRFLAVSVAAFGLGLLILHVLLDLTSWSAVDDQAIAVVAATPLSFLLNRVWTFRPGRS